MERNPWAPTPQRNLALYYTVRQKKKGNSMELHLFRKRKNQKITRRFLQTQKISLHWSIFLILCFANAPCWFSPTQLWKYPASLPHHTRTNCYLHLQGLSIDCRDHVPHSQVLSIDAGSQCNHGKHLILIDIQNSASMGLYFRVLLPALKLLYSSGH